MSLISDSQRLGASSLSSPLVRSETTVDPAQSTPPTGESFDNHLRAFLAVDDSAQVSEEELFAALIHERLQGAKDEATATAFQSAFEGHKSSMMRSDGYVPVEAAAERALADLQESGLLTEEEHDEIFSMSFQAAQLDGNTAELWDGRGEAGDPTIAVASLESALATARAAMTALENGTPLPSADPEGGPEVLGDELVSGETITPAGNEVDGPEGFVWKPESDSDGNLVVILPKIMTSKVQDLLIKDEEERIIERGRGTGVANGGREHFRFNRPGGEYPENVTVEVRLSDGQVVQYKVPNPSERYD